MTAVSTSRRVLADTPRRAAPRLGEDPVYIASQIVVVLQGIISRERKPLSPGVITVGSFHAGAEYNIIFDHADLQIAVRSRDMASRNLLLAAIGRTAKGIAMANGAPEPLFKVSKSIPVDVNDGPLARRINEAFVRDLAAAAVRPWEQRDIAADDFAYFAQPDLKVPGFYFSVGGTPQSAFDAAKAGGPPVAGHHSGRFKIDPKVGIGTGAIAMTITAMELLGKK